MDASKLAYEATQLINQPPPSEGEAVDLAGDLAYIIQQLSAYKRSLLDEVRLAEGERFRTVQSRKASRSYNTAAILSAFDHDLHALLDADAVRLSWRWTELKRYAYQAGVTLSIAPREIEDTGEVDGPTLVGETWTDDYRLEGKE